MTAITCKDSSTAVEPVDPDETCRLDGGQEVCFGPGATISGATLRSQGQRLSYRAFVWQSTSTFCCYPIDWILRLPRPSATRPQVNKYRRSWHCLAALMTFLVLLTVAQTCASVAGFTGCARQLGACVPFLERDPCLKAAVPFFVVSLVWVSVFCSCCCQSPKALGVFLLVGLCGEAVLASYMVAFDQSVRIDDHLRVHLTAQLESACAAASGSGDLADELAGAARCFEPLRDDLPACERLDATAQPALCNGTRRRASTALLRQHTEACVAQVLGAISDKKHFYQALTYSLLYIFAVAHFAIAIAMCAYDVRRKRIEKALGLERPVGPSAEAAAGCGLRRTGSGTAAGSSSTTVANNGQRGSLSSAPAGRQADVLVNQRAAERQQRQFARSLHGGAEEAAASCVTFDLEKRM